MDDKKPNTTMYGEEVCSEFVWLPLDKQKENADKLANITKEKNHRKQNSNKKHFDYYKKIVYWIF